MHPPVNLTLPGGGSIIIGSMMGDGSSGSSDGRVRSSEGPRGGSGGGRRLSDIDVDAPFTTIRIPLNTCVRLSLVLTPDACGTRLLSALLDASCN